MRPITIAPTRLRGLRGMLALAFLLALCPTMTHAGSFGTLVKDINPNAELFSPTGESSFERLGNRVVYIEGGRDHFYSGLWSTDGTPGGTTRIMPELQIKSDQHLVLLNGAAYFIGSLQNHKAIWRTDGTNAGTTIVAQLANHKEYSGLSRAGKLLFFTVNDYNVFDRSELWVSNGSAEGTHVVTTLNNYVYRFFATRDLNGALYFAADYLWRSDGTAAGTVQLWNDQEVTTGPPIDNELVVAQNRVFFTVDRGQSLWSSDGTTVGTKKVKSLSNVTSYQQNEHMAAVGQSVYVVTNDKQSGLILWKSDGSTAGTVQVKSWGVVPDQKVTVRAGEQAVFVNVFGSDGVLRIWRSDGSAGGTTMLAELPGRDPQKGSKLIAQAGMLLLTDYTTSYRLLRIDPAGAGAQVLADGFRALEIDHSDLSTTPLYFHGQTATGGATLWKTDGTPAGTTQVFEEDPLGGSSNPSPPVEFDGAVYFFTSPTSDSRFLWRSNRTPEGTQPITTSDTYETASPQLARSGANLFFARKDGLWKIAAGTHELTLVRSIASPNTLIDADGTLFFVSDSNLWKSDGTPTGTVLVKEGLVSQFRPILAYFNHGVVFESGTTLWQSDGTLLGTTALFGGGPNMQSLTAVDGLLFFVIPLYRSATQAVVPRPSLPPPQPIAYELVALDTSIKAATVLLTTTNYIYPLTSAGGKLYFNSGDMLWKSDGTIPGTQPVGPLPHNPYSLTALPGTTSLVSNNGSALWLVNRITGCAGPVGNSSLLLSSLSAPFFEPIGDNIYFDADDGVHGFELWRAPLASFNAPSTVDAASAFIHTGSAASIRLRACDVEDTLLTFQVATPPAHGQAAFADAASGMVRYTPAAGFRGIDRFDVQATDGAGLTTHVTVTVTVNDTLVFAPAVGR